jgi:hypothetical protein
MKVDLSKQYRTRDGLHVTLFTDRIAGDYPVGGVIHFEDRDCLVSWTTEGVSNLLHPGARSDLVEVGKYDHLKDNDEVFARFGSSDLWQPAHFSHVAVHGRPCVYDGGRSKFTSRYCGDTAIVDEVRTPEEHAAASRC